MEIFAVLGQIMGVLVDFSPQIFLFLTGIIVAVLRLTGVLIPYFCQSFVPVTDILAPP